MDEKALQELSTDSGQGALQSGDDESGTMSPDDVTGFTDINSATQDRKSSGIAYFAIIGLTAMGILSYKYRDPLGKTIAQLGNPDGKRYRRFKR
jgi:hypothetical protein